MLNKEFKKLTTIHLAICLFLAILIIVMYFVFPDISQASEETGLTLEMIIPLFAVTSIAAGFMVSRQRLNSIADDATGMEKMAIYRAVMIIRWATAEGAALFACVGYLLTQRMNLILYATMIGVYMIYLRPIKHKVIQDLKLTDDEAEELRS